ncbi:MAG: hypothetical protein M0Z33_02075 [Actinomycetota bacterium]|nr:hypothetical protein [Actinomycetota bacterium]
MNPDTAAALAQLASPPLRWRIVFALLAADADDGPAQVSLRDLAELTGVGADNARWVNREAGSLVRLGILDRFKVGGSGGNVYRIRDFDDWPADVWRAGARPAKANVTALAEARAVRRADVFARKARAQRPVVRAVTRALARQIAAADQEECAASARAHARTQEPAAAEAHCLTSTDVLRTSYDDDAARNRGDDLAAALLAGCRAAGDRRGYLAPALRRRLEHAAQKANGRLADLAELARDPAGPRSPVLRVELLEAALVAPDPVATPSSVGRRLDSERRRWQSTLRAAELCGDEDLATGARGRLASLRDREHEDGWPDAD